MGALKEGRCARAATDVRQFRRRERLQLVTGLQRKGLSGSTIPFAARLVAVANAYDMLTHAGPKRSDKSVDRALDELVLAQGTKFDPHAVTLCVNVVTRLRLMVPDLDEHLAQPAAASVLVAARRGIQGLLAARAPAYERRASP